MNPSSSSFSFRDPSGNVFKKDENIYRSIHSLWRENWEKFQTSGLSDELISAGLLIQHEEVSNPADFAQDAWKVIRPLQIPFISYSYEWCFSQLKEAALLTLEIQEKSLAKGMSLKDASASNVQFIEGRAVWIDSLSFEIYNEGVPWIAYQQFCRHFLAPLLLARCDPRLLQTTAAYVDGWPLELASRLLPLLSWMDPGILFHIHGSARTAQSGALLERKYGKQNARLSLQSFLQILAHLKKRWKM